MICTSARKTHTQLAKVGRGRSTPFSPYGMNSFGPVLEENFGKETAPMDTRRGEPADAAQPDEICVAAPRAGLRAFGRRGASRRQTDNRAGRLAPVPQRRGKGNHLPTITRIFRRRLAPGWGFWVGNQHRRHKVGAFRVLGGGWGRLAPGDWNQRGDGNQHRRHELGPFCVKGGGGIWNRHGKTRMGVILCHRGPSIHPVVIGAQTQGPRVRMIRVPA